MFNWLRNLFGPRWLNIPPGDPFTSGEHGTHHFEFVSRHAIAETGLHCPLCRNEVAPLGDYRLVRRSRLGEVIRCNGTRQVNDEDVPCPAYLVASPDTEHGDHLIYDKASDKSVFMRFVRIKEADAVKLKYGKDVKMQSGDLFANAPEVVEVSKTVKPTLNLKVGQVWQTDHGDQVTIIRVQDDGDPVFNGWAWCKFVGPIGMDLEWHVDPTGKIRQSMRDPTQRDRSRLVSEIRPV